MWNIETIIATIVVVAILGGAVYYIIRSKKSGAKCIGCPHGRECASKAKNGCNCGCGSEEKDNSRK